MIDLGAGTLTGKSTKPPKNSTARGNPSVLAPLQPTTNPQTVNDLYYQ